MEIQHRTQLPELLKHFGLPMIGVEVGTATGCFSKELLDNGMEELFSVDNWATISGVTGDGNFEQAFHNFNYKTAVKNLKPFGKKSILLKGMSIEMAKKIPDNSLGLVYHDAGHYEDAVKSDIEAYWGKLVEGGIFAFHDYGNDWDYQVKKAVDEFAETNGLEVFLIPEEKIEDSGAWIQKPKN